MSKENGALKSRWARNFILIGLIFLLSIGGYFTRRAEIFSESDLNQIIIGNVVLLLIFVVIILRVREIMNEAVVEADSGRVSTAVFGLMIVFSLSIVFYIDVAAAQSFDASLFSSYKADAVPETEWHIPIFKEVYQASFLDIAVFVLDQSAKALLFDILEVLDITIGNLEVNPANLRFCLSVILYRVVLSATFITFFFAIIRGRRNLRVIE